MRNVRLSYKLFTTLAIALIVLISTNLMGVVNLDKVANGLVRSLYDESYKGADLLLNADRDMYQALVDERVVLDSSPGSSEYNNALSSYEENVGQVNERVNAAKTIFEHNRAAFEPLKHETSGSSFFDSFSGFETDFKSWTTSVAGVIETAKQQSDIVKDDSNFDSARGSLNELEEMLVVYAENDIEQTKSDNIRIKWSLITVVLISCAVVVLFGWQVIRSIVNGIKRTVEVTEQVASGNLRVEPLSIKSKDEVGQLANSINHMTESLRQMIHHIISSSHSLSAASRQISKGTEEISGSATSQASNAKSIMELFKELSDAINSVAVNAESAAELAEQTVSIAGEGATAVTASKAGMNDVSSRMTRLETDSQQIGLIIEVIDEISEQTNLLALNAAIEAARAGEQGRGFAVVADEVRKLAERSGEATKQITAIIKGMQLSTSESVKAVASSAKQTELTEQAFHHITEYVDQSSRKVMEIAAASEEQAAQATEVLQSVESIAAASQQTASASEETASSSQSLAALADELNRMVVKFKV
ncbi:methyl-accepting chemotaxis protein [Cohnella yongneupensis]|uniref:Methyl-accepting chemotaxis protein n=1 Tax=Cohnella yongneupensis TaxID=425006 RepID=A0ABW0QYI3_9BACL